MDDSKLGVAILGLSALVLGIAALTNKKENFTEVAPNTSSATRLTPAPNIQVAMDAENFQNRIIMNNASNRDDVSQQSASFYQTLQDYLNPSSDNLELAQNISSKNIQAGRNNPGAANMYSNDVGDGFSSVLGHLGGSDYPPVNFGDDRAAGLSKCAKDLPMFAASSLLPKPSTNASDNGLSQSAARSLAAFYALGAYEQIGVPTQIGNLPGSKITQERATFNVPQANMTVPLFNASSSAMYPSDYGQVNGTTWKNGFSGI